MLSCTGHSFALLCVPLRSELVTFARRICSGQSAEDIVQDAYIKAWNAWPRWSPEDKDPAQAARSWLYRIVANMWSNERRDTHQHERILRAKCMRVVTSLYGCAEVSEVAGPDREGPPTTFWPIRAFCTDGHALPVAREITQAISRLHPKGRAIVERFYFQGENCEAIAAALQMPATTVRTQLRRARARLRPLLERFAKFNYELGARVRASVKATKRKQAKPHSVKAVVRHVHPDLFRILQPTPDQPTAG